MSQFGFIVLNSRDAPPVDQQPCIEVKTWRLLQLLSGDMHLSLHLGGVTWRMTSGLVVVHAANRMVVTASGRTYSLMQPPEQNEALVAAMWANAHRYGLVDATDISDEFWRALPAAH